jgi:ribosomal protein S18 acetylase RimI-like enzyme
MEIRESDLSDFKKIQCFMELVDHEFFPPLSDRPGGIPGRISSCLAGTDSHYLIAEVDGTIVGALGYIENHEGTGEAYTSFLAVHPEHRGQDVARKLEAFLTQKLHGAGIFCINVTTWSTNQGAFEMYRKLGYSCTHSLKDHRGEGVATLIFQKRISLRD